MIIKMCGLAKFITAFLLLVPFGRAEVESELPQQESGGVLLWTNGKSVVYSGPGDQFWRGNWIETTGGLRDELVCAALDTTEPWVQISVGSLVVKGSAAFRGPPSGKFLTFQLQDSNGTVLPMRSGIKLEGDFATRIGIEDLPKQLSHEDVTGVYMSDVSWITNGGPVLLSQVRLRDVYEVTNEGYYALSVRPVIYSWEQNGKYLDLVDLPTLSTNIHLLRLTMPVRQPDLQRDFVTVVIFCLAFGAGTVGVFCWIWRRKPDTPDSGANP